MHGQDAPYPAGGSPQRWDEEWEKGYLDSSTGANKSDNDRFRSKNYIPISPSTAYYFKSSAYADAIKRVAYYDINKDFISPGGWEIMPVDGALTSPATAYYMRFFVSVPTYNNDLSINYPSTDHDYHPYSNICPIEGWTGTAVNVTGVNLWDEEWELGGYDRTDGTPTTSTTRIRSKNPIPCLPNTTYYVKTGGRSIFFLYYDKQGNFLNSPAGFTDTTRITPDNCYFIQLYTSSGVTQYSNDISINYPSTDTDYHAYSGTTYTVTFPAVGSNIYNSTANPIEQGSIASATGGNTSSNDRVRTNGYVPVKPNTTYTVSGDGVYKAYLHYYSEQSTSGTYSNSGAWITLPATITIPSTANYLRVVFGTQSDGAINPSQVSNVQVRDNVLYGGTYDFVSGVLTVEKVCETFDGSNDEEWAKHGKGSASAYAMVVTRTHSGEISENDILSNYLKPISSSATWGDYDSFVSWSNTGICTGIRTITTVSAWRDYLALNPLQVFYPLATPVEYTLTPTEIDTLLGENNIWTDTDDVEVSYMYIAESRINNYDYTDFNLKAFNDSYIEHKG